MSRGFVYTIAAHETEYDGTIFRSRLEARWAAFFDLVGWRWQYEPIDLLGWTPDFAILAETSRILCEVKPIQDMADVWDYSDVIACLEHAATALDEEILLLGASPSVSKEVCIGVLLDPYECDGKVEVAGSGAAFIKHGCGSYGFASEWHSYACRITGHYDGSLNTAPKTEIDRLWAAAGNKTRWKPRNKHIRKAT